MAKKPPSMFRKKIRENIFEKRYLRFIEKREDREFLASCFELKDGFYVWTAEIDKKNAKRLKNLAKIIKLNRKWTIKALPLLALGAVGAGLFVFVTIFMNPLLENLIERGLEGVLEARVDINDFRLDLFRFSVGFRSLAAADRDAPMTNLFEMGRTTIRFLPNAVLRGKVYIEEIRADALRFGTPRTVSGALPGIAEKKAQKAARKKDMPPLIDLQKFDAMALIEHEYNNLQTLALYNDAAAFYTETRAKWEGEAAAVQEKTRELQEKAVPILNFKISSLDIRNPQSIQTALQLVEDSRALLSSAQSAVEIANRVVSGAQSDMNRVLELEKQARQAVGADIDRLKSFLDLKSGVHREVLEPVIREMLTDAAWTYINYGQRLLEILNKVNEIKAKLPETKPKPEKENFKGRNVAYPERQYPFFFLGVLASDFTIGGWNWAFQLRDVSSSPDISNRPTSFSLGLHEETGAKRYVEFDGQADFRTNAAQWYNAAVSGGNFPINVGGILREAGIDGFSSNLGFGLDVAGGRGGAFGIGGDIFAKDPSVNGAEGTIAIAVAEAVNKAASLDLGLRYDRRAEGGDTFSINTNLDEIIAQILRNIVEAYMAQAVQKLESVFREYAAQYAAGILSGENIDDIVNLVKGDRSVITKYQTQIEEQIAGIERRVRGAAEAFVDEAKEKVNAAVDDAKRQAEEAAAQALRRAEEEKARLEAETRRKAEEAKAAAEAEVQRRAEEAAKSALDSVRGKLPFGF